MWPVSGGTARFPHYAFGGGRGRVVRLVLVAAGRDGRADRGARDDHLRPALLVRQWLDEDHQRRHERAHRSRDRGGRDPDGDLHLDQLPRHPQAGAHEQHRDVVEGRDSAADDLRAGDRRTSTRATSTPPTASTRTAPRACSPRSRRAGSSSRCSASSRPTSSRERARNPKRDIPRAVIVSVIIGAVIYIAAPGRLPRGAASPRRSETAGRPARTPG